ncbi:hypothetical protein N7462_010646 [Penicillium macrosclerotiorum]|uniref:uncharacterized protein n=1 Tax=Penicillium macrosclerotiorum TaxID=303699 RepID=UPI00254820C6|nr:uncharacterized protein N7462_010646 [Penicillium macrosclerotiorum]KAJ5669576.1 hypothetical protein N7462_010646 [Penicillium macrosclerotiorum]
MGDHDDDVKSELEKFYCPPVDSALFAAIVADYDLAKSEDVQTMRQTLDSIKELAVQQEDLPFDPSGTANDQVDATEVGGHSSDFDLSNLGQDELRTMTDATSQTSHCFGGGSNDNSFKFRSTSGTTYTIAADGSVQLSGGTEESKLALLKEMFPGISVFDVSQVLKKSNGDMEKSMDVLLNQSFFDETQTAEDHVVVPKGLDGFVDEIPDIGPSAYTANQRSLSATIKALALAEAPNENAEIDGDIVLRQQVNELARDYSNIPTATLAGLLRITQNLISAATELAAEMVRQPSLINISEIVTIQAPALNLDNEVDQVAGSRSRGHGSIPSTRGFEEETAAANIHFARRMAANAQAAQAARKAKSNPLYGGASAVYRQRAQEERDLAMRHQAAASDRLVDQNSLNGDLDLHGCTVPQAVRIAHDRVEAWWDSLGDTKHIRGGGKHVHGGYKIITGVGLHSRDGTSRLGPAVSRALISAGWRVEIGRGFITVIGVERG